VFTENLSLLKSANNKQALPKKSQQRGIHSSNCYKLEGQYFIHLVGV